jgi:hypothetical protein
MAAVVPIRGGSGAGGFCVIWLASELGIFSVVSPVLAVCGASPLSGGAK